MLRTAELVFVRINQAIVVLLMMAMTALVLANVITRYGFSYSITWAEELSRFLMIWVTYVAAGLALRQGSHVGFEYMQTLLPDRLVPWIRGIVAIGMLVFLGFLAYYGWEFSQLTMRQRSAVLGVPRGIVGLAIPIGAAVFIMHLLLHFRTFVNTGVRDDDPETPPNEQDMPEPTR